MANRAWGRRVAVLIACVAAGVGAALPEWPLHDGDRVVFFGDSITDGQLYPVVVETYVLARQPAWRCQFRNRGVSGDNSGSLARFTRDVVAQRPRLVLYNMGYNDGGYERLGTKRLEQYLANIAASRAQLATELPGTTLVLASPIPSELAVSRDPQWVARDHYPYALLAMGQAEAALARRLGVPFVDLGRRYGELLGLGQVVAPDAFLLSRDGVHPQEEAQALLGCLLLRELGADPVIAELHLDAAALTVGRSVQTSVTDLAMAEGALSFQRTCARLPLALPAPAALWRFLIDVDGALNQDLLTVGGLTAPAYLLSIDGREFARITAAELAEGINLSAYGATPGWAHGLELLAAVKAKQTAETTYWRTWIVPGKADGAGEPLPTATAEERAAMVAGQAEIARLEAAAYALLAPRPQQFRLSPLAEPVAPRAPLLQHPLNQSFADVALTPLRLDANAGRLLAATTTLTLSHANPAPLTMAVAWTCPPGWSATPASAMVVVPPGEKLKVTATFAVAPGTPAVPVPTLRLSWHWQADWPYPLALTRTLPVTPVLTIPRVAAPLPLEGDFAAWGKAVACDLSDPSLMVPAVPGKRRAWNGPADLSAQARLAWCEAGLLLSVDVQDDAHQQEVRGAQMLWSQDLLHVALQTTAPGKPAGTYEFGFAQHGDGSLEHAVYRSAVKEDEPPLQFTVTRTPGRCLYCVLLPWARLTPIVPAVGGTLRFTFSVNDVDPRPAKGFTYLEWTPGINYGKNPRDFGELILGPEAAP